MKRPIGIEWIDVDFRPSALADWRAVYLTTGEGYQVYPIAGWLIQEERAYYRDTEELAEHVNRLSRRVVPAHCDGDGNVVDATEPSSFWCLMGPGDSEPTAEYEAAERAHRAATTAASQTRP